MPVISASPPCQHYTQLRYAVKKSAGFAYPDLISKTRDVLTNTGKPYVIENVAGAAKEMYSPLLLCGSMFGNDMLRRHRLFESNMLLFAPSLCQHHLYSARFPAINTERRKLGKLSSVVGVYGHGGGSAKLKELWEKAMGINWMIKSELSQAIPPIYARWIGEQLMLHLSDVHQLANRGPK